METPLMSSRARLYSVFFKIALVIAALLVVIMLFMIPLSKNTISYADAEFVQLNEPSDDATVVVFETTAGTIRAVLYEKEAPKYCEYFKELVKDGYFDNTYVCTIMKTADGKQAGFVGGSKTTDGIANSETNKKMKKIEVSPNLLTIKGSLCSLVKQGGMFSKSKAGSVLTFMNDIVDTDQLNKNLEEMGDVNGLAKVTEIFNTHGGVPDSLQQYTIFGQVYDGWEAFDAICQSEIVDEDVSDDKEDKNYSPKEEIKFKKVYLSTYGEQKENGYSLYKKDSSQTAEKPAEESDEKSE